VALSPFLDEATSTPMHPMVYPIAQRCSGIGKNAFFQSFLSLLGRLGQSGFALKTNLAEIILYTGVLHCASSWQ
jgi:hypothetical protein